MRVEHERLVETKYRDLTYINSLRSHLRRMSNTFKPFLRLLEHIIEDESISPGATVFLRDVLDNLENYFEVRSKLLQKFTCE
jgi:hypothetical protein